MNINRTGGDSKIFYGDRVVVTFVKHARKMFFRLETNAKILVVDLCKEHFRDECEANNKLFIK